MKYLNIQSTIEWKGISIEDDNFAALYVHLNFSLYLQICNRRTYSHL